MRAHHRACCALVISASGLPAGGPTRPSRNRTRGDGNPAVPASGDPRVLEGRRLDEVGLRDRGEELLEPAVFMNALVRTRPRTELLAVVGVDDQTRPLIGARAEFLHRLAHVAERDEVAELHASGEDDDWKALVLGYKGLAELLRLEPRLEEVLVVEHCVCDSRLSEKRRQMRLPDALGEPRPERALSEDRVYSIGKRTNLSHPVAPRDSHQDRLVITPGEKLDLSPSDEVREVAADVRPVRLKPVKERAREVKTRLYFGVPVEGGNERGIRPLGHILED